MVARLSSAAAVAALVLAATGCGGGSDRHAAVSDYMERVSAIQAQMRGPLLEVSKANQEFVKKKANPNAAAIEKRLVRSGETLTTLRRRLAAVEPPPEAEKMHALLLDLADREVELAGEVLLLARFVPGFNLALEPAAAAGQALKRALTGDGSVEEKASALEAYGRALGRVLRRLEPLEPPPSSEPVYEAQLETLRRVRAAVNALARALRDGRSADLPGLLRRFDEAAISNQTLAVQKAQIAAVKAYNGRIRKLDSVAIALARERTRLERELG